MEVSKMKGQLSKELEKMQTELAFRTTQDLRVSSQGGRGEGVASLSATLCIPVEISGMYLNMLKNLLKQAHLSSNLTPLESQEFIFELLEAFAGLCASTQTLSEHLEFMSLWMRKVIGQPALLKWTAGLFVHGLYEPHMDIVYRVLWIGDQHVEKLRSDLLDVAVRALEYAVTVPDMPTIVGLLRLYEFLSEFEYQPRIGPHSALICALRKLMAVSDLRKFLCIDI